MAYTAPSAFLSSEADQALALTKALPCEDPHVCRLVFAVERFDSARVVRRQRRRRSSRRAPPRRRCTVIQPPSGMGAFRFVILATQRAAQLMRGCQPRVGRDHKPTVIAQHEVAEGKVMQVVETPSVVVQTT
jgi:DNA-directed RNA polymerase omega subunit